jgi:hypothetical protein
LGDGAASKASKGGPVEGELTQSPGDAGGFAVGESTQAEGDLIEDGRGGHAGDERVVTPDREVQAEHRTNQRRGRRQHCEAAVDAPQVVGVGQRLQQMADLEAAATRGQQPRHRVEVGAQDGMLGVDLLDLVEQQDGVPRATAEVHRQRGRRAREAASKRSATGCSP